MLSTSGGDKLMSPLLQVRQTSMVMEYQKSFELVSSAKRNVDPETMMCIFLNCLKKELQAE